MCGIYGIYQLDGAPAPSRPAAARWATSSRTAGRTTRARTSMAAARSACGASRSSIFPADISRSPTSDGSLVVVCNGEIYNFREMRRELEGHGHRFKTASDSEVMLHGYAQ